MQCGLQTTTSKLIAYCHCMLLCGEADSAVRQVALWEVPHITLVTPAPATLFGVNLAYPVYSSGSDWFLFTKTRHLGRTLFLSSLCGQTLSMG